MNPCGVVTFRPQKAVNLAAPFYLIFEIPGSHIDSPFPERTMIMFLTDARRRETGVSSASAMFWCCFAVTVSFEAVLKKET